MKGLTFIIFSTIYFGIISTVALSLGITTSGSINEATSISIVEDPNAFEVLKNIINTITDSLGSFTQIITFSADIPIFINTVFILPVGIGALYVVLSLIRGGS